jgi:hypothetical protein
MDLVVCPNCLNRVVPMRDQQCPSCRQTIRGESAFVPVVVRTGTRLPAHCVVCDLPALVWKKWHASYAPQGRSTETNSFLAGLASWKFGKAYRHSNGLDVTIEVPLCRECELPREPEPHFEEALVTLTVGRSFAQRIL